MNKIKINNFKELVDRIEELYIGDGFDLNIFGLSIVNGEQETVTSRVEKIRFYDEIIILIGGYRTETFAIQIIDDDYSDLQQDIEKRYNGEFNGIDLNKKYECYID